MSMRQPNAAGMKAITISRQYGSGGGEIAARLAERLNWHLIDHELVARVARELGIPEQRAQGRDEYAQGFIARVVSQPLTVAIVGVLLFEDRALILPYLSGAYSPLACSLLQGAGRSSACG